MARLHLLTRAVLAVVVTIFGSTALSVLSTVVAASPEAALSAYGYDSHHPAVVTARTTTDRGPPAASELHNTHDAVGRWSHGASARMEPATFSATVTDDPTLLAKGTHAAATTQKSAQGDGGALSAFAPSDVAANTASKVGPTTAHGAERIAGAAATRGGVLAEEQILLVRGSGQLLTQADGASVRVLQNEAGRFDVVVDGSRGLITTFSNLSQKSLERLGTRYGWE